ncbi:MAG: metal ABC transporter permease [Candidatus Methanomethylophilaceae archaeon]|nr:metal ABC transporter permease [Candidatus Methanomethylophilaceae archaeon]
MTDWATIFSIGLVQNMFMAAIIASLACGIIGTFVVVKRIVFISGGIAHTTFGGVGFAYYLQSVFLVSWFSPMIGAILFAVTAAIIMGLPSINEKIREDSTIGVLWVVGMALGVIFISLTDHSQVTVRSYESILFGNILLVGNNELFLMVALACLILAVVAFFYRDLQIVTFDETHAKLSGINVGLMNLVLYVMVALTCVFIMNIVGIVLVIALLTIPAAMASLFTEDLKETMVWASFSSMALSVLGLFMAIHFNLPPGSTLVLVLGATFILVLGGKSLIERKKARI